MVKPNFALNRELLVLVILSNKDTLPLQFFRPCSPVTNVSAGILLHYDNLQIRLYFIHTMYVKIQKSIIAYCHFIFGDVY